LTISYSSASNPKLAIAVANVTTTTEYAMETSAYNLSSRTTWDSFRKFIAVFSIVPPLAMSLQRCF